MGILHDLTGDWTAPLIALMVVACTILVIGPIIAPRGTLEDEAERRAARREADRQGALSPQG